MPCPVCERERPANPEECRYREFWEDDRSVTRAHSPERIEANERALLAAQAEMRPGYAGSRPSCTPVRDVTAGSDGVAPPSTDVVCIVDRTGTAEEFAERTRILRRLLGPVERFGERFRVALIECRDHRYAASVVDEPCVLVHPLKTPEEALATLAQWQALAAHNDLGAPIEDALAALGTIEWRDGSRRVLVTLGARAPHPPRQEDGDWWLNCCPFGHDWKSLLTAAKEDLDLQYVAVRGPHIENDLLRLALPRDEAWQALGHDASRDPMDVLAGVLGLMDTASVGDASSTARPV